MSKKKILCYVLLTAMLVSMFAAGEVSVAAEQQKPAYSNLADVKSRKEVRSALLSAGISAKTALHRELSGDLSCLSSFRQNRRVDLQ